MKKTLTELLVGTIAVIFAGSAIIGIIMAAIELVRYFGIDEAAVFWFFVFLGCMPMISMIGESIIKKIKNK